MYRLQTHCQLPIVLQAHCFLIPVLHVRPVLSSKKQQVSEVKIITSVWPSLSDIVFVGISSPACLHPPVTPSIFLSVSAEARKVSLVNTALPLSY
jgi:hypothetical protein